MLFQKQHFTQMKDRLEAQGHIVAPLNFDVGHEALDRFIDLPPYAHTWPTQTQKLWGHDHMHIKMAFRGFACTSFGLVVLKGSGA